MSAEKFYLRAKNFKNVVDKNTAYHYFEEIKSSNISNLFGLSREQGLASVRQQLEIWESELNCLTARDGVLMIFERQD